MGIIQQILSLSLPIKAAYLEEYVSGKPLVSGDMETIFILENKICRIQWTKEPFPAELLVIHKAMEHIMADRNIKAVPSELQLTEAKASKERAEADKAKPDPKNAPEKFKALLKDEKDEIAS